MSGLTFRDTLRRYLPPWMIDRTATGKTMAYRYLYAPALLADIGMQFVIEGMRAKYPGVGTDTALPYIGRDRQIQRGPNEPSASYAARLKLWRTAWKTAGSAYCIAAQVQAYFSPLVPRVRVVNATGTYFTLNVDGTQTRSAAANWNWDGNTALWSRFWVIVYATGGSPVFTRNTWGNAGTWGSGGTWGSSATPDQVASIRAVIAQWKAAHSVCKNIIISFDDAAFDPTGSPLPDGTWGIASKLSGGTTQVASRDTRGIYWDGVA